MTVVGTDFRAIGLGPRGYKESNKRKMQDMEELSKQSAPDASAMEEGEEEAAEPSGKRQKAEDGIPRPVSGKGKAWKLPATRAASMMKPLSKSTWEQRMTDKALRKTFMEQKRASADRVKEAKKAKSKAFAEAKKRKILNQQKSAVTQKITKASTLKKLMKNRKQKKLLKTADTN
ncbi:MAG: hypothetical protein WDW38_004536 [Sanguina aurantia]